jgi:hypothetical protein
MSASLIGHSRLSAFSLSAGYGVDVTHGRVLLFGIGTKALPSWDSRTRWNNLFHGLAVRPYGGFKRTCELTSSIVPRGTSFHHPVDLEFPPIAFDAARYSCHCGFPGPSELSAVDAPFAVTAYNLVRLRSACVTARCIDNGNVLALSILAMMHIIPVVEARSTDPQADIRQADDSSRVHSPLTRILRCSLRQSLCPHGTKPHPRGRHRGGAQPRSRQLRQLDQLNRPAFTSPPAKRSASSARSGRRPIYSLNEYFGLISLSSAHIRRASST